MRNFTEHIAESVSYTGVVLDERSRAALLAVMRDRIPDGWRVIAHHMTINLGPARNGGDVGKRVTLRVLGWAADERTVAVKVEGHPSTNAQPHITVAVNIAAGAKPKDSNLHTRWNRMGSPLTLVGTVEEVPHGR